MPPPNLSKLRLSLPLVLLLVVAGATSAVAQQADAATCEQILAQADEHYRSGEFQEAIRSIQATLRMPCASQETRAGIQRLATLAYLRLGDETRAAFHARVIYLEDPEYAPDPILDPPDFVAFVEEHRPLDLPPRRTPPTDPEVEDTPIAEETPDPPAPDVAAPVVTRGLHVAVTLGANVYDGERGQWADNWWDDVRLNSGAMGAAELAMEVYRNVHVGLRVGLHNIPSRFFLDFAPPEPLDRDRSSTVSGSVLLTGAYDAFTSTYGSVGPTLALGTVISYLNDSARFGFAVQPGVRVIVPVDPHWSVLLAGEVGVVMPGTALDLRDFSNRRQGERGFDLLTQLSIGTRYRLPW